MAKTGEETKAAEHIKCSYSDLVPLSDLKPHPDNENSHTDGQVNALAKIIAKVGQRTPIVVSNQSGRMVKGHCTLNAIKKIGWGQCAVDYQDYESELEELNHRVADNEIARYAEFDSGKFLDNLKTFDLDLKRVDFEEFGLIDFELPEGENQGNTDPDQVPDVDETEIVSQLGDLWILGEHRVLCGDSTMIDDVEKLMGGRKYQLMITDLPYGVSYADKNTFLNAADNGNRCQKEIKNDQLTPDQLLSFAKDIYSNMRTIADAVNAYYVFMPQGGEQMMMMMMALKESGYQVKHELIWLKNNHVLGRTDYAYKHEPICYGWTDNGTHKYYGDFQTSIFEFNKPNSSKLHPTMKPVEILEKLVLNSSKSGEVIVDPTAGSGSTLIACEKTNRKCYGMELYPRYCDVIIKRWEDYTGKDAYLEKTGETFKSIKKQRFPTKGK